VLDRYLASRQAQAPFNFSWANFIHIPVQALAIAMLPVILVFGRDRRIAAFAALLFVALIGNAVICGVLSNPHDRYQSRLACLAPLVVTIAALRWRELKFGTLTIEDSVYEELTRTMTSAIAEAEDLHAVAAEVAAL
jgi:hypothetical protein